MNPNMEVRDETAMLRSTLHLVLLRARTLRALMQAWYVVVLSSFAYRVFIVRIQALNKSLGLEYSPTSFLTCLKKGQNITVAAKTLNYIPTRYSRLRTLYLVWVFG